MSFILDALKKSETERQRASTPALFEVKVAAPRRSLPVWAYALGALLIVNIAVLVWVLMRSGPSGEVAATQTANVNSPAPPPGMVSVPATVTFPTTVNVPANSAPAMAMQNEPGVVGASSEPPLVEEPLLSGRDTPVPPDYNANDYAAAISPAEANAIAAERASGGAPSRDEVLARGTQIPELRLDLHVYATKPAERFVFINMRKLREGETLPDGVRVDEITRTGAILSFRGTRFTLDGQ
jgi:general secretion pathway protein B